MVMLGNAWDLSKGKHFPTSLQRLRSFSKIRFHFLMCVMFCRSESRFGFFVWHSTVSDEYYAALSEKMVMLISKFNQSIHSNFCGKILHTILKQSSKANTSVITVFAGDEDCVRDNLLILVQLNCNNIFITFKAAIV